MLFVKSPRNSGFFLPIIFSVMLLSSAIGYAQHPPLWIGIRLTDGCNISVITKNLETFRKYDFTRFIIEIPLNTVSESSFRYYEKNTIDTLIFLLRSYEIQYGIAFYLQENPKVQLSDSDPETPLTDVSGYLLRTEMYPPREIIFMEDMLKLPHINDLVKDIHTEFSAFKGSIVYAASPAFLASSRLDVVTPDVLGVVYEPPLDEGYRAYFKDVNTKISNLCAHTGKPIIVVQSNLVGENRIELLREEMRHWRKGTEPKGIVLNSLECASPLLDSSLSDNLADDDAFLRFLRKYTQKPAHNKDDDDTFY